MMPCGRVAVPSTRRDFLAKSALGFGAVALGHLLPREALADGTNPLAPKAPQFPGSARSVIFLFMTGGPSHLETFDPKPALKRFEGQPLPSSFATEGLSLQFTSASSGRLMPSPFPFRRHGQSGLEMSDLFPNLARHADDLAVVRSCYHESFIHGPAIQQLCTGTSMLGHPSVGSWVTYGLGCESESLPAYVAMNDGGGRSGSFMHQSGFLPAAYQATPLHDEGAAIQNLDLPPSMTLAEQRRMLDRVRAWNERHREGRAEDTRLEARIADYERAFRMQTAAPDLVELGNEPKETRDLYGLDRRECSQFARMCLLSRRMVERGVRFVLLINNDWDGHAACDRNHQANADRIDRPIAGLLTDLKRRGLLESTLVLWAGEFGRTPLMQGDRGRDHNPYGFSSWMAGGGVRGGKVIGATDELGFRAVEDRVHVHDLHATLLSLLGLDHTKLTYLFEGRERRLTDVGGRNNLAPRLTR